ncbi:MAG: bifunctional tetrahydrofolate synthase/dihydrofolate synthase [Gammaproteobacteria bacterium]|nr:bifunctional tetrahydrofolate synthase/dihydrofolate synthase [Gammaproteobacteria bacterium]
MRFTLLNDWLAWQETLHPKKIDPGLARIGTVLQRMGLQRPDHTVITVAGTNGKGSTVSFIEQMLRAAGYRTGAYTSPHLLRYNERIRVNGAEVSDAELCASFQRIDEARAEISLSYFEFSTLAAFDLFARAGLDAAVLEVGMGGRLDAVNMLDADVAVVTSIGLDHMVWLGPDRESIGREKAGIFRPGRPAVCGDPSPPHSVGDYARTTGAPLFSLGRDFHYRRDAGSWSWWSRRARHDALPLPALRGAFQLQNAATALMAVECLSPRLAVKREAMGAGLRAASVAGRFQIVPGAVTRIFDVAHNPHGAAVLAEALRDEPCPGRTLAVFGMLQDKDIRGTVAALRDVIAAWYGAGLAVERGATAEQIGAAVRATAPAAPLSLHATVAEAYHAAMQAARAGDRVVVFGSFYTVAQTLPVAL